MERLHSNVKVVVFDTLDGTLSGEASDNKDVKVYLDYCDQVRQKFNTTVLIIAYVGHLAQDRAKSSTKLRDRTDSSYKVKKVGKHQVELSCNKMKDGVEPSPLNFLKV